jgi:hypothetical protein
VACCCDPRGCDEFFTERNAELSPAYESQAAELAEKAGLGGRIDRRLLDFATDGAAIGHADIVVLHKVVCCYPNLERLLGEAAAHTKHRLFLTYPRSVLWTRIGFASLNLLQRARRRTFRVFLHSPARIAAVAESHGLQLLGHHQGLVWELREFARASVPTPPSRR